VTRNPPDPARVAEARRLYREMGRDAVAAEMGVSPATISRWIGDQARPRGRRKRDDVDDGQIVAMRDRGMSWREMAATLSMSRSGTRSRHAAAVAADNGDPS